MLIFVLSVFYLNFPRALSSENDLIVFNGVEVECDYTSGRGDITTAITMCKRGINDIIEVNRELKFCNNPNVYNFKPLRKSNGFVSAISKSVLKKITEDGMGGWSITSIVVMNKSLFEELGFDVTVNQDYDCNDEIVIKKSKTLNELLKDIEVTDAFNSNFLLSTISGTWVPLGCYLSLEVVGEEFTARSCRNIKSRFQRDLGIILFKKHELVPKLAKIKTRQCHINGSIQPDDYNKTFYAGDVIPAKI